MVPSSWPFATGSRTAEGATIRSTTRLSAGTTWTSGFVATSASAGRP